MLYISILARSISNFRAVNRPSLAPTAIVSVSVLKSILRDPNLYHSAAKACDIVHENAIRVYKNMEKNRIRNLVQ